MSPLTPKHALPATANARSELNALNVMNSVLKTMNFVSKSMNFVLKMMNLQLISDARHPLDLPVVHGRAMRQQVSHL